MTSHGSNSAVSNKEKTKSSLESRDSLCSQTIRSFKTKSSQSHKRSRNSCSALNKRSYLARERDLIINVLLKVREFAKLKQILQECTIPDLYLGSYQVYYPDKPGQKITEGLSGQDSGILRDVGILRDSGITRDMSYQGTYGRPGPKGYGGGAPLSPVKSEPGSAGSTSSRQSHRNWRKFFDVVPNALERRQMEQIKRDIKQGKLRQPTLPPISYFAEDLPMLPGEAGTRLLKTVHVGDKVMEHKDGRHRVESVPGKLAVHTKNEEAGTSNYGILQMQWTTGVPTVKERGQPPQRLPRQPQRHTKSQDDIYPISSQSLPKIHRGSSEEELNLPYLATATPPDYQTPNHFEWEYPLPPPPAKESRTSVPYIKKEHETYCKYYQLVKKKLHLYTSAQTARGMCLPEVLVRRVDQRVTGPSTRQSTVTRLESRSLTKYNLGARRKQFSSSLVLPPIKLGQLVKIC